MSLLLNAMGLKVPVGTAELDVFDLRLERGQRWALLGANGAGKTSVLHTLAGLRRPARGEVLLESERLGNLRRRIIARRLGLLLQDAASEREGTALDLTLMGRFPHASVWGRQSAQDVDLALAALRAVGLAEAGQRALANLSGGERQRVAVAALLAQDPDILLLDEPTNHLDPAWRARLLELLGHRCQMKNAVMLASLQDVNLAYRHFDHWMLILKDRRVLCGPRDDMLIHLDAVYGYSPERIDLPQGPCWLS